MSGRICAPASSSTAVSLATPSSNDGGLLVTVTGPDVSTIAAVDSQHILYARPAGPQAARVIVVGDLKGGPLFTMRFGAAQQLSAYADDPPNSDPHRFDPR